MTQGEARDWKVWSSRPSWVVVVEGVNPQAPSMSVPLGDSKGRPPLGPRLVE